MTLKEARNAAKISMPIRYKNTNYEATYMKITKIGYSYGPHGEIPFVELLDKTQNSTLQARPEECEAEF